ncbi:DUF1565 domain-containing protein [Paenibacillus sp. P26]|nr:DUF1565 domain-containing protein [Paenibacillus sp. P26]UUZ93426.1 DUF1565 domain-containing protein [Paenibacillus sp. P25]
MEYHVAKNGNDHGQGTRHDPFLTINKAASVAVAGDTVIVHEGVYREWVKPRHKGLSKKEGLLIRPQKERRLSLKGRSTFKIGGGFKAIFGKR